MGYIFNYAMTHNERDPVLHKTMDDG